MVGASDSLSHETLFKAAQDAVKTLEQLDDRNKLRLYAHYKQATVGPAQGSRPSVFQQVATAKWDAWSELQSMSSTDAMLGYCSLVDEFVPGWRENVQEGHISQNQPVTTDAEPAVTASDEILFKAAQDAVKTLQQLDDRNKLRLYAHYKQATVGPAQGSRPSVFQQVARAKWDAWSELQSMSSTDAMLGYCSLVDEFVPGWRENVHSRSRSESSEAWCQACTETSLYRWGFADTRFEVVSASGGVASHVRMTSDRYPAISRRIKGLWEFFQKKPRVQGARPDSPLPELPEPSAELLASLPSAVAASPSRCRAGTSLGRLRDPWLRRCGAGVRMPELVMQPRNEEEVISILQKATGDGAAKDFMVIPVGGRTGDSAGCPESEDDSRPVVALDMRRMNQVLWIRHEDRLACVEAGITATALEAVLHREGYMLGLDLGASMDFATLGGCIASKVCNGKQPRYGALEEMLVEVRVATSSGLVWQNGMKDRSCASVGRRSNGLELPGLLLGSAGCLGVITAAVLRIHPLPERLERDSLRFPTWDLSVSFLRQVSQLPRALKPAACRLLDSTELTLAQVLREDLVVDGGDAFGVDPGAAALVVLEGSAEEVAAQRHELTSLATSCRGVWTGPELGEVFHQMNLVLPYLRDLGMDHDLLLDSVQLTLPWSRLQPNLWPCILQATSAEHRRMRLSGALKLWKSLSPSRDGALLRVHVACSVEGLNPAVALNSFESLLRAAETAAQPLPERPRSDGGLVTALRSLKAALDPHHVLGCTES